MQKLVKIQTDWDGIIVSCRFIKSNIITLIQHMDVIDRQRINALVKPELKDILPHNIEQPEVRERC